MNLCHGRAPPDKSPKTPVDTALDLLHDCAVLLQAQKRLTLQSQDKALNVIFRARISAMIGILNIFLDPELPYTWRKASMIVAKAQGHGKTCARSI
jgi:hypothetical protein